MDNVNFQCGSCGKLMAVAAAALGQQVRCPHCQQVVLAPAPAPAAASPALSPPAESAPRPDLLPPESRFSSPAVSEIESIFSPAELHSDTLFAEPQRALVEMPPPIEPTPAAELAALHGSMESTLTYQPFAPAGPSAPVPTDHAAFTLGFPGPTTGTEPAPTTDEDSPLAQAIPKPQIRAPSDKGGWLLALFIVPLISYSILATIAVVYLRFYQQPGTNQPHPLETIPDVEGETPGVKPAKKRVSVDFRGRQEKELPERLRTTLGQKILIGDLEVTPLSLEFRPIEFVSPESQPFTSETDSLVLNLRVRNVSRDFAFHPLDPFFVRRWEEVKGQTKTGMPFTYLTVGKSRFYGGPIRSDERETRRETIKGQRLDRELQPGESLETFICTSPDDRVKDAVEKAIKPMLWRVQVRRGMVQTPNRGEQPATAVVGVEFTSDQIQKGGDGG